MKFGAIANAVFVIFVILKWITVIYAEELLKDFLQLLFLLFLVSVGFRVIPCELASLICKAFQQNPLFVGRCCSAISHAHLGEIVNLGNPIVTSIASDTNRMPIGELNRNIRPLCIDWGWK